MFGQIRIDGLRITRSRVEETSSGETYIQEYLLADGWHQLAKQKVLHLPKNALQEWDNADLKMNRELRAVSIQRWVLFLLSFVISSGIVLLLYLMTVAYMSPKYYEFVLIIALVIGSYVTGGISGIMTSFYDKSFLEPKEEKIKGGREATREKILVENGFPGISLDEVGLKFHLMPQKPKPPH